MNLEEYLKVVKSGTRVYVMLKGEKLSGTAGNSLGPSSIEPIIKFDNGAMAKVTEQNVSFIHIEVMN